MTALNMLRTVLENTPIFMLLHPDWLTVVVCLYDKQDSFITQRQSQATKHQQQTVKYSEGGILWK